MSSWDDLASKIGDQAEVVRKTADDVAANVGQAQTASLAEAYLKTVEMMEALKAQRQFLEAKLAEGYDPDIGEFQYERDGFRVTVGWPEKLVWDEDKLKEILGDSSVGDPAFVEREIKIAKRLFDKADPVAQAPFVSALTRKPGARKVAVERI